MIPGMRTRRSSAIGSAFVRGFELVRRGTIAHLGTANVGQRDGPAGWLQELGEPGRIPPFREARGRPFRDRVWRERHRLPDGADGDVIVHRKGATPAGAGVLGIIPGSMATPGYVVRGKGVAASLNSAAHGAGRRMSRTKAKGMFTWDVARRYLRERGVTLLSAGLDDVPMAYKDIDEVMAAQRDLVEPLARFDPRLVKMAPSGEPPED